MTRRGSLAYYLAAVAVGCFFMALLMWLPLGREPARWAPRFEGASGFLFFYFFAIVFGSFTALVFGFLLRALAKALRWNGLWHWLFLGAVVAGVLNVGLRALGRSMESWSRAQTLAVSIAVGGPMFIPPQDWWRAVVAGIATAYVLFYIHGAFAPRAGSPRP